MFTVDDDTSSVDVAAGDTTSTSSLDSVDTTIALPAVTTSTAIGRPTTTAKAAPASGGFAPPKPGEYRYRVESKSVDDGETTTENYDAELLVADLGGGKQRHRLLEQGTVTTADDLVWRADGRYVVATDDGTGPAATCDLQPDLKTLPYPAKPGTKWNFKSTCKAKDPESGETYTIDLTGSGHVVGNEKRAVAGATVDAIHIRFDFTDDDPGDGADTMTVDEYYAPSLGLTIEEIDHSAGSAKDEDGSTFTYDSLETRKILSLQPA